MVAGGTEQAPLIRGTTQGGREWTPSFIVGLDQSRCIGCGRCYKVCPRKVFTLVERDFAGEDDDEDEEDGLMEEATKVMAIADGDDCIGCGACARICPRGCHSHAPQTAA